MSPLRYRGLNFSAQGGYYKESDRVLQHLETYFYYGEVSPNVYKFDINGIAQHLRGDLNYTYLRRLHASASTGPESQPSEKRYRWWVGGTWSTLATYRYHYLYSNNAYNWDVLTNLNLTAQVDRPLRFLRRDFHLAWRAFVPVVGWAARPYFTSSVGEGFLGEDKSHLSAALASGKVVSLNRFFRLNSQWSLTYPIAGGNALRLTYVWDYYTYASQQPVAVAGHALLFSTLFRF
ncbi:hypothetical protein SAMN05421823_102608 [Catalinimonas alkaloidigena]|uniref:Uncharacterized protein n=2 Tax=Catalinimonas alkaloidigena TaxID=1075417 RepID=A0A1G9BGI5_9BACT|nr:hypothetical protein SAMN05421823_102608 [Catalinimonas alkaloidigena]